MTVQQVALQLLDLIGVRSLDPTVDANSLNARAITPGDLQNLAADITAAFQRCLDKGPSSISSVQAGGILMPPTSVTLPVTQYSPVTVQPTGWADWMNECTIRIAGDNWDNRIRRDLIAGTFTLQRPVTVASGTYQATVYGDALLIPTVFKNVVGPIKIPLYGELRMVGGMDELDNPLPNQQRPLIDQHNFEYRSWPSQYSQSGFFAQRPVGPPRRYYVDTTFNPAYANVPVYLRVSPMPTGATPITFTAKQSGPTFVTTDIWNGENTEDPGTVIPEEWDESILLPVARKIASSRPLATLSDKQAAQINDDYMRAIEALQGWRPGIGNTPVIYV